MDLGFHQSDPAERPSDCVGWTGLDRSKHNLAPQVGLEPTTLRLTAVRVVLVPAATGCYKLLSFLQFTSSLLGTV